MKICFWGNIADAVVGNPIGGGEVQIVLLAKALVETGHEVVFLDYTISEDFVSKEGIRVYSIKGFNDGIKIVRMFHRFNLIYKSLKEQKAQVYYCRVRDFRHIIAYKAARRVSAKFILAIASDLDVLSLKSRIKYLSFSGLNSAWTVLNSILCSFLYPWLFRHSDLILVQHEGQKKMLLKKGIKPEVFNNLIDLNEMPLAANQGKKDLCYVGALDKRKGLVQFFELVKKAPEFTFKVIGAPRDNIGFRYFEKLKLLKNVKLLGMLSHQDTLFQISNSKALISTSPLEGFPNIFLEAWAYGIPVFSLFVDPAGVIEREELGIVAHGDADYMLNAINNLKTSQESVNKIKKYVAENHALNDHKLIEIKELFNNLVYNNNKSESSKQL
jgi:glycosyltransferase involved in cell wall biosynthesis